MKKTTLSILFTCAAALLFAGSVLASDSKPLKGKKVAVLIGEGFHSGETVEPKKYLKELGAKVVVISTSKGVLTAYNDDTQIEVTTTLADVCAREFDALVVPGGHGPAAIRDDRNVQRFVREFDATNRPLAAICHGPQVLASAGVLKERTVTCVARIGGEMESFGARYLNAEVVVDRNLITSRTPPDLPAFKAAIAQAMQAESR